MRKIIFGTLAAISFLTLIGTAGASDLGQISLMRVVIQGTISLIGLWIFSKLAGVIEK